MDTEPQWRLGRCLHCRDEPGAEVIPTQVSEGQPVALSGACFCEGLRSRRPSADKPRCFPQGPCLPDVSAHSIPVYFAPENRGGGALLAPFLSPEADFAESFQCLPILEVKVPVPPAPNSLETRTENSLAPGGGRELEERRVY